jgi:hypothetical protein
MIYSKWTVEIPDYVTHITLSKQRRKKYYTVEEQDKIPKKYLKQGICFVDNIATLCSTKEKIVKNSKSAGTPKYWKINGQDLWNGNLHPHVRAKVSKELHQYFGRIIDENLVQKGVSSIEIGEDKRLFFIYTFNINIKGSQDIDNMNVYIKTFSDTLTTRNNPNQSDVVKMGIIPDDNPQHVKGYAAQIMQHESKTHSLTIDFYLVDKDFSLSKALDQLCQNK